MRESLFWSKRGEVACVVHAPYRGSDTWEADDWILVDFQARIDWHVVHGKPMACEHCVNSD